MEGGQNSAQLIKAPKVAIIIIVTTTQLKMIKPYGLSFMATKQKTVKFS